jgi:hypothetical protein
MQADLNGRRPSLAALSVRDKIEMQAKSVEAFRAVALPLETIKPLSRDLRRFVMMYESELKREKLKIRIKNKTPKTPVPVMD